MEKSALKNLTVYEKALLTTGNGSWKTKSLNGKLNYAIMSDGPHGLRKQEEEEYADINKSNPATCFPTGSALASTWNDAVIGKVAKAISREAMAEGVSVVLGPAINIKRSPLCGRNFEYYSEDPYLTGHLATSYITAMQEEGVGTSIKHFAVNNQETHRQTSNSMIEERALREIYLRAFEMCIKDANPATVMASYNRINCAYACANSYLLKDILRDEWGYEGTVVSDWGAAVRIVDCIKAGLGLEMPDSYGYHAKEIVDAIDSGELTEEELDNAVCQVLSLADRYPASAKSDACDYLENHLIAYEAACEAAVLLKHTGILPVKKDEKLLIIGDMAIHNRFQGGGSSHITTLPCKNTKEALEAAGCILEYKDEVPDDLNSYDKVIYFCGLTDSLESEGYDRRSLELPKEQKDIISELVLKSDKVILVTFGGAPFIIPKIDEVAEILHMHLGGQAVGEAVASLLLGEKTPSGKLAETWPLSLEDLPNNKYYATGSNNVPYVEGIYVGYRYFETCNIPVQFPFGYGLSYTLFAYSNLKLSNREGKVYVSYCITNVGNLAGAEISQVYVLPRDYISVPREAIRLAGYHKDYLEPGESVDVEIILDDRAFSIYDEDNREFCNINGDYTIAVGASINDLRLTAQYEVCTGKNQETTIDGNPLDNHKLPELTLEGFYGRYEPDKKFDFDVHTKGKYTKYDSMETVCKASWIGRRVLAMLVKLVPIITKTPKDDPAAKMVVSAMCEAPLDSLLSVSSGAIKPNVICFLVENANGHFLHGLIELLSGNKKYLITDDAEMKY